MFVLMFFSPKLLTHGHPNVRQASYTTVQHQACPNTKQQPPDPRYRPSVAEASFLDTLNTDSDFYLLAR